MKIRLLLTIVGFLLCTLCRAQRVQFPEVEVTAVFAEDNLVYVQEMDRSAGIACRLGELSSPAVGDLLRIEGYMATLPSGERTLDVLEYEKTGEYPEELRLRSMGMARGHQALIGAPADDLVVGLLVTVWGQVKDVGADSFCIANGSCPLDLEIEANGFTKPVLGEFVVVSGISSLKVGLTGPTRLLRTRYQEDIVVRN